MNDQIVCFKLMILLMIHTNQYKNPYFILDIGLSDRLIQIFNKTILEIILGFREAFLAFKIRFY